MKRNSFLLNSLRTLSNPSNPRTLSNQSTLRTLSNPSNQRTLSNPSTPSTPSTLSSPILRNLGFLWLLAACSLTSCSSDSSGSPASIVEEPVAKPRPLTVEVTETPFHSQTNEQGARQLTRASEITISSLKNFIVFNNRNTDAIFFEKNGSNWVGDGYWPVSEKTPVTFYATNIANDRAFVNGTNSFSFTVLEDVFNQIDLLAAKTTAAYSAGNEKISLAFDHITTAVTFSIALSKNAAAAAKGTVVLQKAMLYNIPNTASYSFTSDSWGTPAASKSDYTLTTNAITLSTELKQLPCNYLFLIPQTLSAYNAESNPNGAYLEVDLSVDGVDKTVRYPVALTLEQGWIQPVNISIKAGAKDTAGNSIFNKDVDELTN